MYCGSCGTQLGPGARFCRACGSRQAEAAALPPPPPPAPVAAPSRAAQPQGQGTVVLAGWMAIFGGVLLCFLTLYACVYAPLHYHLPLNWGQPLRFGDVLAFAAGAAAIVIGVLVLVDPRNPVARGAWLLLAAVPVLVVALLWTFPATFHLDPFAEPFYLGNVYFAEFGRVEAGSHLVQVPLLCGCAILIAAGLTLALAPRPTVPLR